MIQGIALKYIIGAAGALLLVGSLYALIANRNHWKDTAVSRQAQITAICNETREAANNPDMACGDTVKQVELLGEALNAMRGSLARQNAAVAELERRDAELKADTKKAVSDAQERANRARGTSEYLKRQNAPHDGSCEPSEAVKELWR